jgi:hypothetical protein
MIKKKQKVRYEFFNFQTGPTGLSQQTLVLENPANIKFVCTGTGGANDSVIINNSYELKPIGIFTTIGSAYPYELILNNNINEFDVTNYSIRIISPANSINLKVVVKYYID